MKLYDSGEKLTKGSLERFEKMLGKSLPSDYKDFMMKDNGGTPEEDLAFSFIDVTTNSTNIVQTILTYESCLFSMKMKIMTILMILFASTIVW